MITPDTMTTEKSSKAIERVHEVEIAADCDHQTHENTMTVFVVADSVRDAQTRAAQLIADRHPEFFGDDVTALHCGFKSLDSAEWRQFIDGTQDSVEIGPEVPV